MRCVPVVLALMVLLLGPSAGFAESLLTDQEIAERLARLEEGQRGLNQRIDDLKDLMDKRFQSIDGRFESMDKRFESMDKRFESIERRFDAIDRRFDQMMNVFIAMVASFAGIVAATIGFALWDRKTTIKPALDKTRQLEEREVRLEIAVKEYAKREPAMAEVLRTLGML